MEELKIVNKLDRFKDYLEQLTYLERDVKNGPDETGDSLDADVQAAREAITHIQRRFLAF